MTAQDGEFFWDWYKHEESLSTNRATFFLVGQSMLIAAYGALRGADAPRPINAIIAVCILGLFTAGIWLLVTFLHYYKTRIPLVRKLVNPESPRSAVSGDLQPSWRDAFRSYFLMGAFLPIGIAITWVGLLAA